MNQAFKHGSGYVSVIGSGSWGTTLAALLAAKGYDVILWAYEPEVVEQINRAGENIHYLPGVALPRGLRATTDISYAVDNARFIINAVPTQHIRRVFAPLAPVINKNSIVLSVSKGIEIDSLLTPSQVLNGILAKPVAALSGPSFAKEVIEQKPTAVTLAMEDRKTSLLLQELFTTDYFRVYTHDDVIGVEIGGALKNVIAIAAGICDGLSLGHNARAALITRAISEITRLGLRMKGREITFSGLSGLGDLVLTCTGPLSRNYTVGVKLGQGQRLADITSQTKSIAEGVTTTLSAYALSKKYEIEMPITEQVYQVLYKDKPPAEGVMDLMTRTLKPEFNG